MTNTIDPDMQCPDHGCARWRCVEEHPTAGTNAVRFTMADLDDMIAVIVRYDVGSCLTGGQTAERTAKAWLYRGIGPRSAESCIQRGCHDAHEARKLIDQGIVMSMAERADAEIAALRVAWANATETMYFHRTISSWGVDDKNPYLEVTSHGETRRYQIGTQPSDWKLATRVAGAPGGVWVLFR